MALALGFLGLVKYKCYWSHKNQNCYKTLFKSHLYIGVGCGFQQTNSKLQTTFSCI